MSDQQIKITGDYKYQTFLNQIRSEIQSSRTRAALAVNSELIYHYGQICQETGQKFEEQGWGTKIIDKLAADLNQKGYSPVTFVICALLPRPGRWKKYCNKSLQNYPGVIMFVCLMVARIPMRGNGMPVKPW